MSCSGSGLSEPQRTACSVQTPRHPPAHGKLSTDCQPTAWWGPMTWAAAQSAPLPAVVAPSRCAGVQARRFLLPCPPPQRPLLGPHATIQQGSSGPDVVLWQKIVGVTSDGQFGPNTAAATKTWQSQHGLTADGVVGPKSWAAAQGAAVAAVVTAPPVSAPLVGPTIPAVATVAPPVTTHAMIQQGSSGPDVVLWQKVIGVAPDGKFGPATAAATKTWQSQHGLTADGVVGPKTWTTALGSSAIAGWGPTYTVQPNDTPFTIAHRFTGAGSRMFELAEANPKQRRTSEMGSCSRAKLCAFQPPGTSRTTDLQAQLQDSPAFSKSSEQAMDDRRTAITGEPDPMPQHAAIEFVIHPPVVNVRVMSTADGHIIGTAQIQTQRGPITFTATADRKLVHGPSPVSWRGIT